MMGDNPQMKPYRILLHPESLLELRAYRQRLLSEGLRNAGRRLRKEIQDDHDLSGMGDEAFLERLVNTKPPLLYAESWVYGDGRDWNADELSILGDVGVAVRVEVFDDGRHSAPEVHAEPFLACLLFVPGALLRNDRGGVPADWSVVAPGGEIGRAAFEALYERRLLPALLYANEAAGAEGRMALVTVPGLGCGQFAGPFRGRMGGHLRDALAALLEKHHGRLPHVRAVYYDPYNECRDERREFGGLSLLVRPLLLTAGDGGKPQLCPPWRYAEHGDDFGNCRLFSVVAWDHVSWPGNDFYGGARATDDGVKAAATNSMAGMTGVQGAYNAPARTYDPPPPYRTWGQVVRVLDLRIAVEGNLSVLPSCGEGTLP
jgi:hypothetical protein